jgi:tetratricopeptide (TPR) repeat protein
VELNPDLAEAHAALGEITRRRGQDGIAAEHLQRAAKLKPADPSIWQSLGLATIGKDPAEALRHFLKSKELGNANPYLQRQIAYALDMLGRLDEAAAVLRDHYAANPQLLAAMLDMGRFELWVRGRPDRALKLFTEAYRQAPAFVDAGVPVSFYPALVYLMSGHAIEASPWLARQAATASDSLAVATTRLLLAAAEGDRQALTSLAGRPPDNIPVTTRMYRLRLAADAALLAGEYERAVALYRELLERDPYIGAGRSKIRRRRSELKLAYALRKLGRNAEADPLLQETPEVFASAGRYSFAFWTIQPSHGIFYTDGELYALRGEKQKSLQALNTALAMPDDGLVPFGSVPVPIEDSPLLGSLRGEPGFDAFRQEVVRRREIMKRRVGEASEQTGLSRE